MPRWLVVLLVFVTACVPLAWLAKGRGYKTAVLRRLMPNSPRWMAHPTVASARPGRGEGGVAPDAFVSCEVRLPNHGKVVDAATINPGSVRLYRTADRQVVAAQVNTSAAGDVIVLTPARPLDLNTQYTFEVLPALKDTGGASFGHFIAHFTTAAASKPSVYPVAFEKVALREADGHGYTGLAFGPDGKLYACTSEGRILRFTVYSDGTLGRPETVLSHQNTGGEPRLITGICFDPASTLTEPVIWISHGQFALINARDWTGKISRLSGPDLRRLDDVVVGLPRSTRDHLNNQLTFGPDGGLYFGMASNTAMGAPDAAWGARPERQMTASILRIDLAAITQSPLDVKTEEGGTYNPWSPWAPVSVYATGLRNVYDLLWHRNGQLYAPVNGSSAGGSAPADPRPNGNAPGLSDIRHTESDTLLRIEPGGYYGHPNPLRGEFVLHGGNPTPGPDPFEVPQYPVGTRPHPNWRRPVLDFGKHLAPCGILEYKEPPSLPFGGLLDGRILVTRYSGGKDVIVLTPGGPDVNYAITECVTGIDGLTAFADPLDLIEEPITGNLYVVEHGAEKITLLRPKPGVESQRVYRQTPLDPGTAVVPSSRGGEGFGGQASVVPEQHVHGKHSTTTTRPATR